MRSLKLTPYHLAIKIWKSFLFESEQSMNEQSYHFCWILVVRVLTRAIKKKLKYPSWKEVTQPVFRWHIIILWSILIISYKPEGYYWALLLIYLINSLITTYKINMNIWLGMYTHSSIFESKFIKISLIIVSKWIKTQE